MIKWLWFVLPTWWVARPVAISPFTAERLALHTGIPRARITVVPVCVGEEFRPVARIFESEPSVLIVGTGPNKNVDVAIEALRDLDCSVTIVGRCSPSIRYRLEKYRIRSRILVDLTSDQIVSVYVNSDMLLFISLYEGFGMPIVEAQAIGRPVVASDIEPINYVSGGAARLVNPTDARSVRNGMLRLLTDRDLRDSMVRMGFRNRERFTAARVADGYAKLYRELMEA